MNLPVTPSCHDAVVQGLREITQQEGTVLCFDEVMTGFRISKVGQQLARALTHARVGLTVRGHIVCLDWSICTAGTVGSDYVCIDSSTAPYPSGSLCSACACVP